MTGSSNSDKGGIPRIAVDVMGGDFAPRELVRGAVEGAQQYGVQVLLVGDKSAAWVSNPIFTKQSSIAAKHSSPSA